MRSLCKYWCWIGRSLRVLKLIIQNAQESYHVVLGVRGAGGCLGEGHPLLGVAEHQWLGQGGGLGGLHGGIFRLWGGGWGSLPQQHRKVNPLARWKYDKLTFKNYNKKNPYNFKATPRYGLLFFFTFKSWRERPHFTCTAIVHHYNICQTYRYYSCFRSILWTCVQPQSGFLQLSMTYGILPFLWHAVNSVQCKQTS